MGTHRISKSQLVVALAAGILLIGCASSADFVQEEVPAIAQPVPAQPMPPGIGNGGFSSDDLQAARVAWDEAQPASYTYRARIFTETTVGDAAEGCGAGGGSLRVSVVDGEVVSAQNEEAACSIDLDDPQRLPLTGDEIFERALKFANVGPSVELTVADNTFPERVFTESEIGYFEFELLQFEVGADASPAGRFDTLVEEVDAARLRWAEQNLTNYELETIRFCECDIRIQPERIVDGSPEGNPGGVGGVEALFALIERAIADDAAVVEAFFNPVDGVPARILVDEALNIADDEFTLEVVSLIPAEAADVLTADVLIANVLDELGAQVGGAPDGAVTLDGARYCGLDQISNDPGGGEGANSIARRCFTSGATEAVPSVLVQVQSSVEGDPIVSVLRADGSETVVIHTDSSQDNFGSGGWTSRKCLTDSIRFDDTFGLNYFNFQC